MESTTPPIDLVEAAKQTYAFSIMVDEGHNAALKAAISSALEVHRAQVVSEVADAIQKYADDLSEIEEDDDSNTAAAYVAYTSELIRMMGHPEIEISTYVPQDGDLIQIITTGKVHKHANSPYWVLDLDRGDLLDFDIRQAEPGVRVRLLDRDEDG